MSLYTINVSGDAPLWPELKAFNGMQRRRRDAAFSRLWAAMFEAFEGDGALDTRRARAARTWAAKVEAWGLKAPGTIATHETARFTFSITREG